MAMADAAPDQEQPALGYFEDDAVWGAKLRVKGLGDGLSKLADVEPVSMRRGQRGVLLVEFFVDHVAYPPGESEFKQPGVDRLHVLRAGMVTIVDPSTVRTVMDEHQRKLDELANRRALFDSAGEPTEPNDQGDGEPDGTAAPEGATPIASRRRRRAGQ